MLAREFYLIYLCGIIHTKKNYNENRCQHTLLFSFAYDALRHICKHLHPKCKLWGFREHKPYYVCRLHCFGVNFVPHLFAYRYKRKRRPDVLTLDAPEKKFYLFRGFFFFVSGNSHIFVSSFTQKKKLP